MSSLTKVQRKNANRKRRAKQEKLLLKVQEEAQIIELENKFDSLSMSSAFQELNSLIISNISCLRCKLTKSSVSCNRCGWEVFCFQKCRNKSQSFHESIAGASCDVLCQLAQTAWKVSQEQKGKAIQSQNMSLYKNVLHVLEKKSWDGFLFACESINQETACSVLSSDSQETPSASSLAQVEYVYLNLLMDWLKMYKSPCLLFVIGKSNTFAISAVLEGPPDICIKCKLKLPLVVCERCSLRNLCTSCSPHDGDCQIIFTHLKNLFKNKIVYLKASAENFMQAVHSVNQHKSYLTEELKELLEI